LEFEEDVSELDFRLGGMQAVLGDLQIRDFLEIIFEGLLQMIGFAAFRLGGDRRETIGEVLRETDG
jgi:hypothetical protein